MTQIDPEQIALARRPLPAMRPVPLSDWLRVTPDYAAQLREKGRLLDEAPDRVLLRSEGSAVYKFDQPRECKLFTKKNNVITNKELVSIFKFISEVFTSFLKKLYK